MVGTSPAPAPSTGKLAPVVGENTIANQSLYNGKEMQDELDLGWMDYGARMYLPTIGRWNGHDKFFDAYASFSPYSYTLNNPISNIDVNGEYSVSRHHEMTYRALTNVGFGAKQAKLIAHYASYYADNPTSEALAFNNGYHFMWQVNAMPGVDYSGTASSQDTSWDPATEAGTFNNNIRHSMRSPEEAAANTIDEHFAMLRGMGFGWDNIFESATFGKLGDFTKNSTGIQTFGVGLHALQDGYAHKGTDMVQHDVINDALGDWSDAKGITSSAVLVHSIMSGDSGTVEKMLSAGKNTMDLTGISGKQLLSLHEKLQKDGKELTYDWDNKCYIVK
jgi:RHS repeat-associated protein